MTYVYLFLVFALVAIVGSAVSRFLRPAISGMIAIVGLAATGLGIAVQTLINNGLMNIASFAHGQFGRTVFACDGLSAWFMVIVCALFIIGSTYGVGYLSHYETTRRQESLHWLSFAMTLAGMLILFTTHNLITFLVGWELMAIGSFFAVIFEYDRPQVISAGLNYFIQSHIAVLILTSVFCWSIATTGDTTTAGFAQFMEGLDAKGQIAVMALLIAGFGFKAGLVPFHSWLPYAHPAAPSHISALMSGVIVKAGIYGIIRFGSFMTSGHLVVGVALLIIGVVSGIYGIVNAASHRDFKRALAYCTIENVGIISMGIGISYIGMGTDNAAMTYIGMGGAMLHTLNHAIFKALLFFGAGNIYVSTHTRNIEELGGLGKKMPVTAGLFLTGSLAIGGLPPFGGFISELLIYIGLLKGFASEELTLAVLFALSGASLAVIGGVSMMSFTRLFGIIFLGAPRKELHNEPKEVGGLMLAPAYVTCFLVAIVIAIPSFFLNMTYGVTSQLFPGLITADSITELVSTLGLTSKLGFVFILVFLFVIVMDCLRKVISIRRAKKWGEAEGDTWGCGYLRPIKGIQYTGKSYSKTLTDMCKAFMPSTTRFKPLTSEEIFPHDRSHISCDNDFWDSKVIEPGIGKMNKGLEAFQFIQNGNLQRYIVYGLGYTLLLVLSVAIFG